ncbi:FtsK/SpoIIIE domain-containing protein [Microbacterium sp. W4I20]|uniref:FtsK/SpoIIIE domain-containing protein n=1 Tax=Microbacterium sp. W4I20 TaxID=3042262 RepID=UPI0027D80C97|nr:FtsK/SpoIIIE domain-containing protein [Microbacterium sp. W4I20]
MPVAAGVVLWLITGSLMALCFAALGPLMLVASLLDAARSRRRDLRRSKEDAEAGWASAEEELQRRNEEAIGRLRLLEPDAASCLAQPPLRGALRPDASTVVVVGSGTVPSGVRCSGGDDERGRAFRERAAILQDAPITVPLGGGVCLRGAEPLIHATARALVVQLSLRFSAAQLSLVGAELARIGLGALPHATRLRRGGLRLGVGSAATGRVDADALIWLVESGADVPEGITTVIDVVEPRAAVLRTPQGISEVAVECLSAAQAAAVAQTCLLQSDDSDAVPESVALHELSQSAADGGLPAVIGRGEREDVVVDIVEDGPHAIVTGTTGTGKSELLVTWVTAIAAANGPERVSFILADFKGGTAFEPLRELRQVAAVITDLDEDGARRGVSSLTAELRRREAVLAAAGARDVREAAMPRLIIVVDEFAALLQEHPDLGAVFTDVAARGRALGMHLILGTQRASGVARDALAANCPLRISLRVADAADSRLVIGTDAAAQLPGGATSRGLGLVRRPEDRSPVTVRVALTGASDLRRIGMRWAASDPPQSPWLPALPTRLALAELSEQTRPAVVPAGRRARAAAAVADNVVLGRADDPDHQAQPLEVLRCGVDRGLAVLGAPGSGRTSVLRVIAAQRPDAVWVPHDLESAWDRVTAWAAQTEAAPQLVLCDGLDALIAALPVEHAQQFAHRWEQIVRGAVGTTFVLTSARAAGPAGRLFDMLPRRALLRMSSRVEHLAAGGEPSGFVRERKPGRARIGEREVQFAWVEEDTSRAQGALVPDPWVPGAAVTAVVSSAANVVAERLRAAHPDCEVILAGAEPHDPTARRIMVADAETWQRSWSVWQRVRAEGEILIRAEQPADLRQLAGVKELPPYARPHAGRAWSVRDAQPPRRVVLPALASG